MADKKKEWTMKCSKWPEETKERKRCLYKTQI